MRKSVNIVPSYNIQKFRRSVYAFFEKPDNAFYVYRARKPYRKPDEHAAETLTVP